MPPVSILYFFSSKKPSFVHKEARAKISVLPWFLKRSDGHKPFLLLNKPRLVVWESLSIPQFSEMSLACKLNIRIQAEKAPSSEIFMPVPTWFHFLGSSVAPSAKVQHLPKHSSIHYGRRQFSKSQERANHVFEFQTGTVCFAVTPMSAVCFITFQNVVSFTISSSTSFPRILFLAVLGCSILSLPSYWLVLSICMTRRKGLMSSLYSYMYLWSMKLFYIIVGARKDFLKQMLN